MNSESLLWVVWGKTQAGTVDRHPLVCHMLDVGQVAWALVAAPAWKHVATRLGSCLGVDPLLAPSLCGFLASLHDLGKAAPAFQAKSPPGWQSVVDAGLLPDPDPPRDFDHGAETYASLLAAGQVERVRSALCRLVTRIEVHEEQRPGRKRPGARLLLQGNLQAALQLAGEEVTSGGSPGGLSAWLTLPRVTFLLSPVRGARRNRLPEAVKPAIRFLRPAEFQTVAAGAA